MQNLFDMAQPMMRQGMKGNLCAAANNAASPPDALSVFNRKLITQCINSKKTWACVYKEKALIIVLWVHPISINRQTYCNGKNSIWLPSCVCHGGQTESAGLLAVLEVTCKPNI